MIRTEIKADLTIHENSLSPLSLGQASEATEKAGRLDTLPTASWELPRRRWLVIVPTLAEVARYKDALSVFGDEFEGPDADRYWTKALHLQRLVEDGRNVVATHELFKQLSREVYEAIEAQDYTLVIDEEIEVVRPYPMPEAKKNHLFNKGYVYTDPVTRRVDWNKREHPISSFPFKTDIPKLCEAGHLVESKTGLLIVETPSEFLRCFEEVWVATYMFDGTPLRAYLDTHHFPIDHKTVAKDTRGRRFIVPFGSPEAAEGEREVREELRRLVKIHEGRRNMIGQNSNKESPLTATWFNTKARREPESLTKLASSISEWFKEIGVSVERTIWTTFKGKEEDENKDGTIVSRMRVPRLRTDSKVDGEAHGFLALNARATNAYRNVEALAYPVNVYQHGDVRSYFNERDIATSEDLYAISTLVQWLWRSRIRKEPRESITVYLPSERMRGLFLEWLHTDSTKAFVDEKMEGARRALKVSRSPGAKPWSKPKSAEVGFEAKITARIAHKPLAIAAE
jgi:hypothetical protein